MFAPSAGIEAVVTRSRNLTAAERLGVYHNAYYARLLACLREEFPILLKTITEEVFDAFAFGFQLRTHLEIGLDLFDQGRLYRPTYFEGRPH